MHFIGTVCPFPWPMLHSFMNCSF